jgi:NAD kinase
VPINAVADGNTSIKLKLPAEIEIKKAPYTIKVAKSLNSNYFKILTTKVLWGIDKRKNK